MKPLKVKINRPYPREAYAEKNFQSFKGEIEIESCNLSQPKKMPFYILITCKYFTKFPDKEGRYGGSIDFLFDSSSIEQVENIDVEKYSKIKFLVRKECDAFLNKIRDAFRVSKDKVLCFMLKEIILYSQHDYERINDEYSWKKQNQ